MTNLSFFNITIRSANFIVGFTPHAELETRISELALRTIDTQLSPEELDDLRKAFKHSHSWFFPVTSMQRALTSLPKETIKLFIKEIIASGNEKELNYYLQRCFRFLNNNDLLALSKLENDQNAQSVCAQQHVTKELVLKNGLDPKVRSLIKWFLYESKQFFHQFMALLVGIVGLDALNSNAIDDDAIDKYTAKSVLSSYWKLLQIPAIIFAAIHSKIEIKTPAFVLTAISVLSVLTSIIAYKKFWKPCPTVLPGFENLSFNSTSREESIIPRMDILRKIEKAFQSKKSVILVGEPGTGKTWIARSFAEQVNARKVCSSIPRLYVFSKNAADLVGDSSGGWGRGGYSTRKETPLDILSYKCRPYKDKIVVNLDEIHVLFQKNEQNANPIVEKIKTFCEDFRILGATTTEEYNRHIRNQVAIVGRRFEIIHLGPLENSGLKKTLSQHLENVNSKIAFKNSVFDYIIENASRFNNQTSQLDAAKTLLNYAIQKMVSYKFIDDEAEIDNLRNLIETTKNEIIKIGNGAKHLTARTEWMSSLAEQKAELATAEANLTQKNLRAAKIKKMEAYYHSLNEQSHRLAKSEGETNRQWLELQARITFVKKFIAKERRELGLPVCLNRKLTDAILEEPVQENPPCSSK